MRFCAALMMLTVALPLFGWGPTGHRVVGLIAESHLSEDGRVGVEALLGRQSLAQVSTWADEIRSDPAWDHAGPWHYVTIEDGDTYASSIKNPRGDVIAKINEFTRVLADRDADQAKRAEALKWLVHLIGDVHQPLHVGRGKDRGGNTIDAVWFGQTTNMHRLWDSGMIDKTQLSYTELAGFIDQEDADTVSRWQQSPVIDWVNESIGYRKAVYTVPDSSWEYSFKNLPLVKQRLLQAGVRLAATINQAFAPAD